MGISILVRRKVKVMSDEHSTVFETEADVKWSTSERIRWKLETWIVEPGRVLIQDSRGVIGMAIIGLYIFLGTIGLFFIPEPEPTGPILLGPFEQLEYPFGTNNRGSDMFSLMVHSIPNMFKMILSGAVFSTFMATVVGTFSGYLGGVWDRILSTIADIALTLPGLPLVIVIGYVYQPTSPYLVGILVTINAWGGLARSIRSQVLTMRGENHVERSRALGLSTARIIRNDVLPGLLPYISVNFVNRARGVIFSSVALYFLAILPFTNFNWGVVLNQAYSEGALNRPAAVHWLLIPVIVISFLTLGFLLLAQSFDRIFNPRARTRQSETETAEHAGDELANIE